MKNEFDPIKREKDGVKARKMIWSTAILQKAIDALSGGDRLVANPFYEGNIKLMKQDLVFKRTAAEIEEWKKCAEDIIYFANNYCKLMTPEGIQQVTLRGYQVKYLKHLQNCNWSIYLAARQAGKTTTSAIYLLWYSLFNTDKNILVLGNKLKTSREIVDKIKKIFIEVPFFLKPGIIKWNDGETVFDNGCRIMSEATTINSGIGFTIHVLLCDEFAHIAPNIAEPFYNNITPVLSASKGKMIITSTQNGFNLFYRLYTAAKQGLSDYSAFVTTWQEIPEWNPDTHSWDVRDEAWHQRQVANYGSEEAFNRQFGTNFDINANTLISTKKLKDNCNKAIEFVEKDLYGVSYSNKYFWNPNYEPMDELKKYFMTITIDIAEGVQNDYTTYCFNRMFVDHDECIGIFHANDLNIEACTKSLQEFIIKYCDPNKLLISVETNLFGELFIKQLLANQELNEFSKFDESIIIKYYNDTMSKYTYGLKISRGNKTVGCTLFKDKYEKDQIINNSTLFLNEAENFCDNKGNNTYQASFGHDDVVMAQIQLVHAQQTIQYKNLKADIGTEETPDSTTNYNPYNFGYEGSYISGMDQIYQILEQEGQYDNRRRLGMF